MSLRDAMWQEVEAHEKARSDLARERMEHAKTKAALFEVLSGHDGCGADGHFGLDGDPCCTDCAGWKRYKEIMTPEEREKVEKAFRAKKRKPSGWGDQLMADSAERAGWGRFDKAASDELKLTITEDDIHLNTDSAVEADEAERAEALSLDFVRDEEKAIDIVERANRPAEPDERPRTEDYDCQGCGQSARFLHMGSAWCSEPCRDDWVRAANRAVEGRLK